MQLSLRLVGRSGHLRAGSPMKDLAMQVAFLVPLCLPIAFAAAQANPGWFYPAVSLIVGAHYLPFIFLYGLRHFAVLAVLLMGSGLAIGLYASHSFALSAWVSGFLFLVFAVVLWTSQRGEEKGAA